ncbi:sec1 family domain-containing protein MIP3-like [Zingiber officinale]|uniref:sec1 family domain-containing protein MIP3-like n=1 Tax=Zingiber officinale TaxID=94328 RepID=UPI001C4BEDD1|nr:sec1 family domain-containing protein MIP3-like [Zingiber officinale]XP_042452416.1 sec1 family domain-containing protein MIP3-like [Zingiber officinale]
MASADLIRTCRDSILQISDKLADSILYLDAGCLEAFQFIGAFKVLLELGVHSICSLENASPLDAIVSWNSMFVGPAKKVVIITSRLLSDAHRYILRCLGTHRTVLQCIIYTSISEIAHSVHVDSPLGSDAFHEYETLLVQDYEELLKKSDKKRLQQERDSEKLTGSIYEKNLASEDDGCRKLPSCENDRTVYDDNSINFTGRVEFSAKLFVSVDHFPMIFCPLSPRVFILPSEGTVAEACLSTNYENSISPGLPSLSAGSSSDGDDVPPGATLTANFLYHLLEKMDLKMEIFSLGDTSKIVGKMMMDMSSLYDVGRRNKRSAGLLLIDRTIDLLTPCCHGDSFLDRLLSSLPRRERILSSLPALSSQAPKIDAHIKVQRAPLDIRVPFGAIFGKNESVLNLSEGMTAFASGWSSGAIESKSDDHTDKFTTDAVQHEVDLLGGSFLSNNSGTNYLETLLDRRAKDGAILVKKWLLETLRHEKLNLSLKGRSGSFSASELHTMLEKFAQNQMSLIRNKGIIQLALAAEIVLGEPRSSHWEAFVNAEKILAVTSQDTSQSLSSQIRDFINTSILLRSNEQDKRIGPSHNVLSFQDALLLSMIGYILAGESFPTSASTGPYSWEEEHSLKEAVVDAIMENPSSAKLHFLHGLSNEFAAKLDKEKDDFSKSSELDDFDDQWGNWDDEDTDNQNAQAYDDMQLKLELRDRVDQLFKFFNKLSSLRQRNSTLREGLAAYSRYGSDMETQKSLLYKLLTTLLAKYDVPGLVYHSSAVGRFLKSGFGRFGLGQAKPSFGDQSVLFIFVVGGMNSLEVREAMEAIAEYGRSGIELIVGGTTLLTPNDMFDLLLGSSSYF